MNTFYSLYNRVVSAAVANKLDEEIEKLKKLPDFDEHHLECLLKPENQAPVMRVGDCQCSDEQKEKCKRVCFFNAIKRDDSGNLVISPEDCTGCGDCIDNCKLGNLVDRKDILPVFGAFKTRRAARICNDCACVYKPV